MKIILWILTLFILYIDCIAQTPSPEALKNNLKQKIFKVNEGDKYESIYADLEKSSFLKVPNNVYGNYNKKTEEEYVIFDYSVYNGSFLNKYAEEHLLFIRLAKNSYCNFFSHASNYGNTTFIIIFDKYYNQISEVFFQDAMTYMVEVCDINNDGLNEVIMKSSYGQMGCFENWIEIFEKDFNHNNLRVVDYHSCLESGIKGESILLNSEYVIDSNRITFKSILDYYLCLGVDNDYKPILRFLKTEYKADEYEYRNKKFYHVKSDNNVNWDDERLEF
jgi:hypothetical protein